MKGGSKLNLFKLPPVFGTLILSDNKKNFHNRSHIAGQP